MTALHCAADKGALDCLELLIERSSDVNAKSFDSGWTPLMFAARKAHIKCVWCLIAHGANVNVKSSFLDQTPLTCAVKSGNTECVQFLIDRGADLHTNDNNNGITVLMEAAFAGRVDCVELLIKNGCDIHATSKEGMTALMFACLTDSVGCARALILSGVDVNVTNRFTGETPLLYAILHRAKGCTDLLLEHAANVNARSSVHALTLMGHNNKCIQLLRALTGVTSPAFVDDEPPLSCLFHNVIQGASNTTVLMFATIQCDEDVVKKLLRKGAHIDAKNDSGITALMLSCFHDGGSCITEVLLDNQADPNITDDQGESALHKAACKNLEETSLLLIEFGGDVNYSNAIGQTPRHIAVRNGHFNLATMFENYRTDQTNMYRQTSIDPRQKLQMSDKEKKATIFVQMLTEKLQKDSHMLHKFIGTMKAYSQRR